jgi:hypothetical protein
MATTQTKEPKTLAKAPKVSAKDRKKERYPEPTKVLVMRKYPLCLTKEDRHMLRREAKIESLTKLYNFASRLVVTRGHGEPEYDPCTDVNRLLLRFDPSEWVWTKDMDRYIKNAWRRFEIENIAFFLNTSETAVLHRARHLGLRNVPKYWDVKKVSYWLGLTKEDLINLKTKGVAGADGKAVTLDLKPCTDPEEEVRIWLVSTSSLARVLAKDNYYKVLIEKKGADEFFIKDILESAEALQITQLAYAIRALEQPTAVQKKELSKIEARLKEIGGEAQWEPSPWVSHGHTSMCPYYPETMGTFFDGYDKHMVHVDPEDLHPSMHCASDDWRRGMWRQQQQDRVEAAQARYAAAKLDDDIRAADDLRETQALPEVSAANYR